MAQKSKFEEMLLHKKAGILVPLFSVYSRKSFGIADFSDLKLLIDWVKLTNQSILQLLPMNEMGPVFCPYDALSSFALEPVYISLQDLPLPKNKSLKRQIDNLKKNFPLDSSNCDYAVREEKLRILREVFLLQGQEESQGYCASEKNAYWLYGFSLFKSAKLIYGLPWWDWLKNIKRWTERGLRVSARKISKRSGSRNGCNGSYMNSSKMLKNMQGKRGYF